MAPLWARGARAGRRLRACGRPFCVSTASGAAASSAAGSNNNAAITYFYNDVYEVELPEGHRFPMEKYRLVRQLLQRVHADDDVAFAVSPLATLADLATTHDREYARRYLENEFTARENRVVGFPWSTESVDRSISSVGGTLAAARAACARLRPAHGAPTAASQRPAVTGHLAGGTHHAFASHGEGFCVFSDIAVAANVCLEEHADWLERVLIIDLDVHQGNGNAVIFQHEPRVFTFSMQCRQNLFSAEQTSDEDVFLEEGTGDEGFLAAMAAHIPRVVEAVRPQLVFYQAGVDPMGGDRLGKLSLSREGLRQRNELLYETLRPLIMEGSCGLVLTLGGGYPRDLTVGSESFSAVVEAHADVYSGAVRAFAD